MQSPAQRDLMVCVALQECGNVSGVPGFHVEVGFGIATQMQLLLLLLLYCIVFVICLAVQSATHYCTCTQYAGT